MHVVILLAGHGLLGEQGLEAGILATGVVQMGTGFLDAGIGHLHARLGGGYAGASGLGALFGAGKVGLGLGQTQTKLGVLDDHQGVALLDVLELLKPYLLDETLHTGVLGSDVLAHTGVVGKLYMAEVAEIDNDDTGSDDNEQEHHAVVNVFLDILHLDGCCGSAGGDPWVGV